MSWLSGLGDFYLQNMPNLPDYIPFMSFPKRPLKELFIAATDDLLELLTAMFQMNPLKRCTAPEVLSENLWHIFSW